MTNRENAEAEYPFVGNERYFIVCAGRTGSSLLAAILADAGARFGLDAPDVWNRNAGALETPESQKAFYHYTNAYRISPEKPTTSVTGKLRWSIELHRGKNALNKALSIADYVKCPGADLIVYPSFRLGYFPRVIVNYRRFEDHARSFFQMQAYSSIEWISDRYCRIYRNSLALLSLYGGCVVSYDDLTEGNGDTGWIRNLSEVTALPFDSLAESHRKRAGNREPAEDGISFNDRAADDVFEALEALRGRVIPPSRQAIRNWTTRFGA